MSSLIEERLLEEIAALQARLSHLETAEGGVADAILDGLILYDVGFDASAANWAISAAATVFENDPNISVSVTVPTGKTATLICIGRARFNTNVARNSVVEMRTRMDGTTSGNSTGYIGAPASRMTPIAILGQFTGVAAGNHTVTFQGRRLIGTDTVTIMMRQLAVLAIQA